jgi:O-methyltransferase involved in polyketide biosynthesis
VPTGIDTSVPHSARVWNYWLGGRDNFAADRAWGDHVVSVVPDIVAAARADRAFLARAVRFLAGDAGIRQFLDIGTGLPTAENTHEVAQAIAPECRIVYVDNDPVVLAHARALLTSTPAGATDYVDADARDTDEIVNVAARTLDLEQPVALMLLGVLCFVADDEAHAIVDRLLDAVPSGSYLVVVHPTAEIHGDALENVVREWNNDAADASRMTLRSPAELARFFDRVETLEPGVVSSPQWRPDPGDLAANVTVHDFCAVGRKP